MKKRRDPECWRGEARRERRPAGEVAEEMGLPLKRRGGEKLVIGRREWVFLPELGVGPLHAKTDSGARSSSLHAEGIELSADGERVRFATRDHYGRRTECETAVGGVARVKSSTGEARPRVWIAVLIEAGGGLRWRTRLTLADRDSMQCQMLLGRRALSGRFLIDTQGDHLLGGLPGH